MPDESTLLFGSIVLALIFFAVILWQEVFRSRLRRGAPLLELEPRRTVPWGFAQVLLVFLTIYILPLFITGLLLSDYDLSEGLKHLTAEEMGHCVYLMSIANVAGLAVAIFLLSVWCKTTIYDFGLVPSKIRHDVWLGLIAFLMLAGPVYAIQAVLGFFIKPDHPILRWLDKDATGHSYMIAFNTAVIVAPIAEELVFRVILQGWLEKVALTRPLRRSAGENNVPLHAVSQVVATDAEIRTHLPEDRQVSLWPIVISATVFATMHVGQGPSPIPLFFLAIGLGYIYQRTHRVLPCITVHALLNATSLFGVWVGT